MTTSRTPRRPAAPRTEPQAAFPIEDGFRVLMEDAESGVLVLGPDRLVASANPAALKLLGVSAAKARRAEASTLLQTVVAGEDLVRDLFAAVPSSSSGADSDQEDAAVINELSPAANGTGKAICLGVS